MTTSMRVSRLVFATVLVAAFAGTAPKGTVFTTVMNKPSGTAELKTWVDGPNFKTEVTKSSDPGMPEGTELLTRDGGVTLNIIFNPKQQYLSLSREQFNGMLKRKVESHDGTIGKLTVTKLGEEDGGKIAGFATRHYRVNLLLPVATAEGATREYSIDEELWTAVRLPKLPESTDLMFHQSLGSDELDKAVELEDIPGFRLKRVVWIKLDGVFLGESNIEVKTLTQGAIPASEWQIPPGFTKKEIPHP
jgi:hypothetical protein